MLVDVERLSSRLVLLPQQGASPIPRVECAMPGSSKAQACYVAAWSLPRCFGLLEEATDEWLWLLVPDDLLVHLSSTTTCAPAVRVQLVPLESLLELGEAFTILIKLGLELSQLR